MGSYNNQITIERPNFMKVLNTQFPKLHVGIDRCLLSEIKWLWENKIYTTGCCCGHNIKGAGIYIGVVEEHQNKMISLGYKTIIRPNQFNRLDSFYPKT